MRTKEFFSFMRSRRGTSRCSSISPLYLVGQSSTATMSGRSSSIFWRTSSTLSWEMWAVPMMVIIVLSGYYNE